MNIIYCHEIWHKIMSIDRKQTLNLKYSEKEKGLLIWEGVVRKQRSPPMKKKYYVKFVF